MNRLCRTLSTLLSLRTQGGSSNESEHHEMIRISLACCESHLTRQQLQWLKERMEEDDLTTQKESTFFEKGRDRATE